MGTLVTGCKVLEGTKVVDNERIKCWREVHFKRTYVRHGTALKIVDKLANDGYLVSHETGV